MKKTNILLIILATLGLILAIPSMVYMAQNKTVDGYNGQNYYFINNNGQIYNIIGTIILGIVIIGSFIVYFKLIKNSKNFVSLKVLFISIFLIGIIFLVCLPNTSTDVFYYMGTGRVLSEYNQNPYYHTVGEILKSHEDDVILKNTGVWNDQVVVYGPLWVIITFVLNKISFSNINILLFLFKISALLIHLLNCLIIYKLTKKKKFVVIYGFCPMILLEFLVNVHNDIYLVFFVLASIYFLKNKNNLPMALLFLMCSVLIKHISILLLPIFILYKVQDKKIPKRIFYLILYSLIFVGIVAGIYLLFFKNIFDIFLILNSQKNKLMNSIYLLIFCLTKNKNLLDILYSILFFTWLYLYIIMVLKQLMRNNSFKDTMNNVYLIYITFIFGVITNLTAWYLIWLFIPFAWIKSKYMKNILWISFFFEIVYIYFVYWHSNDYIFNIITIPTIFLGMEIRNCINRRKIKQKQIM